MEGLTGGKEIYESIKIGNGDSMEAIRIGNLKCEVTQIFGEKLTVTLNDVKYLPNLCVNLLSLNKVLKKGFKISNDGVIVSLNYKYVKLTFDRVILITDDCVTGVLMKPISSNYIKGFSNTSIRNERTYDINYLHKLFEHCGQETIKNTIEMYAFMSFVKFETCE
jgi:hypothetical protein